MMQTAQPDQGASEWRRRASSAWRILAAATVVHALAFLFAVIGPAIPWYSVVFVGSYTFGSFRVAGTITLAVSAMRVSAQDHGNLSMLGPMARSSQGALHAS